MSWTKSGTVSVTNNSKKVYGAGTPWVSNGKTRPGDEFIAPNGARHEVESVQSNTELTLVAPYMGVTASGQSYSLLPLGLLPAELAVGVSDMTAKNILAMSQLFDWETSAAATIPMTNPATGVTSQVKPIAGLVDDIAVAKTASGTSNTPSGNIAATTVQAAINELDTEKAPKENPVFSGNVSVYGTGSNAALHLKETAAFGVIWDIDVGSANAMRFTNYAGGPLSYQFYNGSVEVRSAALLGYGPGAGGSVTQATSKSTAVTLNKPTGQVTMNGATLNAGATVMFTVNNSVFDSSKDVVIIKLVSGVGVNGNYQFTAEQGAGRAFVVIMKNVTSVNLSEQVTIQFVIIKGATE